MEKKILLIIGFSTFILMQEFLFFKVEKAYIKLNFADILYVQAEKKYVNLVAINKSYTTLCSIGHVEKILPAEIFCKVHRSYIVSLEHTIKFDNEFVYIGNRKIPISEQYKNVLKNSVITLNCELNCFQSENNFNSAPTRLLYKNSFSLKLPGEVNNHIHSLNAGSGEAPVK
jgi:hypothetical protein